LSTSSPDDKSTRKTGAPILPPVAKSKLTGKRAAFVREYAKDCNGTQAAIRAGYKKAGAHTEANRLLKNAAVRLELGKIVGKLERGTDDLLREVDRIAFSDIAEVFDENGQLKPVHEMSPDARRAIASIEPSEYGPKVKLWSKPDALRLRAQQLGLLIDRRDLRIGVTSLADLLSDDEDGAK
jgi:phage terminase small subunit